MTVSLSVCTMCRRGGNCVGFDWVIIIMVALLPFYKQEISNWLTTSPPLFFFSSLPPFLPSWQDIEDRIRVLMSSRVNYYKHNAARSRMGIRYRQALAGAALFIYTPLMKAILGVLNCQPEYDPADGEEVPVYRIADDLSVICRQDGVFTSPYATYRSVSIFLLIIYVYAFPLFIGIFLLYLKWKNLLTDIRTVEYWGVLYYPYDSEYFWFEAVMQLRKTAVVTIVVFSPDGDVRRLLLFALFASLLFIQVRVLRRVGGAGGGVCVGVTVISHFFYF